MANSYTQLNHEEYKVLEEACKAFIETVHTSVEGYYHKSFILPIGSHYKIEFHGPIVKAWTEE